MQFIRVVGTTAVFALFGTLVPIYAQHDKPNEKQSKRPEQRQSKQPQAQRAQSAPQPQQRQTHQQAQRQPHEQRPQARPQAAQRPRPQQQGSLRSQPAHQQQQPERTHQQAAAWQQKRGWVQKGGWQEHSTWQQGRDQHWEADHRSWAQRGGYGGYYIPQASFSLSFGSDHWFRMRSRPVMYMGYPRFAYGGFSFMLLDPWPMSWAENWYATDDVYIGYDDGYYLYNRRHPGVGLAVTVAL